MKLRLWFDILAKVRHDLGGEIVGISFKRKQERWLYEFKVVEPGGRLRSKIVVCPA